MTSNVRKPGDSLGHAHRPTQKSSAHPTCRSTLAIALRLRAKQYQQTTTKRWYKTSKVAMGNQGTRRRPQTSPQTHTTTSAHPSCREYLSELYNLYRFIKAKQCPQTTTNRWNMTLKVAMGNQGTCLQPQT